MTDEELHAIALPLLEQLIGRRMLVGNVRQSPSGLWISVTIIGVVPNGLILEVKLEDDAKSIASATPI